MNQTPCRITQYPLAFAILMIFGQLLVQSAMGVPPDYPCDSCGGIVALISSEKTWAYFHQTDSSKTHKLRLQLNAEDKDTRPSDGECVYDTILEPEWLASDGEIVPVEGYAADWIPDARGDNFKVTARVNDGNAPCDDEEVVTPPQIVKAFSVKVSMQVMYNGVSAANFSDELWDYQTTPLEHFWADLAASTSKVRWTGNAIIDGEADEENMRIHIEYTYRAVPDAADLYGWNIKADLTTDSSLSGWVDVEDADFVDGSVTASLGVGAGYGVASASAGIQFDVFDGDCAEAGASVARGYYCEDGLGTTQNPGLGANNLTKWSEREYDPVHTSWACFGLTNPDNPWASQYTPHIYEFNPPAFTTGWQEKKGMHGTIVKAGHTAYAGVMLRSSGTNYAGAGGHAVIHDWHGVAKVSGVELVEPFKP